MSKLDLTITNEAVIPVIETDIFAADPGEHSFAIGMLATDGTVVCDREEEMTGYLRLRANVYADQTRMIPKEAVREDGTEVDEDDARSTHWAVFERASEAEDALGIKGLARVVGSIRGIVKSEEDDRPLPIEDFFPEAFADPLPVGSVEISRYIARHEKGGTQSKLSTPLFMAIVGHITAHALHPSFGVVEEKVEKRLQHYGVPMQRIADPRYVEEYAADNLGFQVFIDKMARDWGMYSAQEIQRLLTTEKDISYFNLKAK